ncbi:MAG TPA: hypothetical protein DCQ36_05385 [Actinobacteria bacterium]|nr:hypothetical protein [Actinomycetota bacterium]
MTAGATLAAGAPAQAAPAGFIAAPNSLVGVNTQIVVSAPSAAGQTVAIGAQVGSFATTLQTTLNSNGYGYLTWNPGAPGTWTFNGLGVIANLGSTTASVVPMPTYTELLTPNNVQQGVPTTVTAAVVAPIGQIAPTGTVTLQTGASGIPISSAGLYGSLASTVSTASLPWTPPSLGQYALQANFGGGAWVGSTSAIEQPFVTGITPLALRMPATLNMGTPTIIQGQVGYGFPDGTVAFFANGVGISGSVQTVNGVATIQWTPPGTGVYYISASYTGAIPNTNPVRFASGTSNQSVNIQGPRPVDNLTVVPPGQPVWSIAQPIIMTTNQKITLSGTSQSGTPVIFSEQGPCVIAGAVLTALSPGQCSVTAQSPGTASIAPGSETYTITVNAPPRRPRR